MVESKGGHILLERVRVGLLVFDSVGVLAVDGGEGGAVAGVAEEQVEYRSDEGAACGYDALSCVRDHSVVMTVGQEGQAASDGARVLRRQATIELEPTQPFAFDATFHKPDHFPTQDNFWEPGVRWQTMRLQGQLFGLRIEDAAPRVRVGVWADDRVPEPLLGVLADELAWRANLWLDLADFDALARRDPKLSPVARRWRGMRPMHLARSTSTW